ncbi:MAG: CHAT domain-containing protein [Candidatus Eisenbacteria sp.]|nr:CHAT domain-containing protein [Candidatus Eisenbacteria bacterium]
MRCEWRFIGRGKEITTTLTRPDGTLLRETLEAPLDELLRLARDFRREVQDHLHGIGEDDEESLRARARRIFGMFCPPRIHQALREIAGGELAIEYDPRLGGVPWELLHDGTDYLCLQYRIAHVVAVDSASRSASSSREGQFLIVADPSGELEQALEEGNSLLDTLREEFPDLHGSIGFHSRNVSRDWLIDRFFAYDIAHYAGHVKDAFVLGGGERLSLQELQAASGGRPFPALIFINACGPDARRASSSAEEGHASTEGSRVDPVAAEHDSVRRMAEEAISGGTRCIISVPMTLPDTPLTRRLAEEFYRGFLAGLETGEALLKARQRVRDDYPSRLIWGIHRLYGDSGWTGTRPAGQNEADEVLSIPTAAASGSEHSFVECRHAGCRRMIPARHSRDPFNAFCDQHQLSLDERRLEAKRLLAQGEIAAWMPREALKGRVDAYVDRLTRRLAGLGTGRVGPAVGPDGTRYAVRLTRRESWMPLVRSVSLQTRLSLLKDPRRADSFPFEGRLDFQFELTHGKALRRSKRLVTCRALVAPDMEALLRDDFVWRPMEQQDLKQLARQLTAQEAPGVRVCYAGDCDGDDGVWAQAASGDRILAWVTPMGAEDGPHVGTSGPLPSSGKEEVLAVELISGADHHGTAHATWRGEPYMVAAEDLFLGLLEPRSEDELGQAILTELRRAEDVEVGLLADSIGASRWLTESLLHQLAWQGSVRATELEDGARYVTVVR